MGLETIGSLNQYLKSVKLEHKWGMRQSGNAPLLSGTGVSRTSLLFVKSISSKRSGLSKSQIQKKLQKIKNKLKAGARLTGEEKEFLRRYAPELYRKVTALEKERENYEERLKEAKTRDEAERIKMEKMANNIATANKEDPEFEMIRVAQFQAAEEETRKAVSAKPWKHELDREKKEKLERAAREQVHRERKMKKLRRWDKGELREEISDQEREDQMENTLDQMPEEVQKAQIELRKAARAAEALGESLVDGEAVTKGELAADEAVRARERVMEFYGAERAMVQVAEAQMAAAGSAALSAADSEPGKTPGFSMGKAAYSAAVTQVTEISGGEEGTGERKYNRKA